MHTVNRTAARLLVVAILWAPCSVTAAPDNCRYDARRETATSILIVSGRVEAPEEQVGGLRRALQRNHVAPSAIEMQLVDESDPQRIQGQLDASRLEHRLAVVTLSGHIAKVLSKMSLGSPTVFATIADPLSWPIVDSLGARKANATGITWIVDLEWKYLEILKTGFPQTRRVGILADKYFFDRAVVRDILARSEERMGIAVVPFVAETREELERAFSGEEWKRVDAWIVPETPVVFRHEARVIELVRQRKVPNIFGHPTMLRKGALLTFGVDFPDMWDEIGKMVSLICGGLDARAIPIVRPHRVFLGVSPANLAASGLSVDPRLYRLATFWH